MTPDTEAAAEILELAADNILVHGLYQGGRATNPFNDDQKCAIGNLSNASNLLNHGVVNSAYEIARRAVYKYIPDEATIVSWSDNSNAVDVRETFLLAAKDLRNS